MNRDPHRPQQSADETSPAETEHPQEETPRARAEEGGNPAPGDLPPESARQASGPGASAKSAEQVEQQLADVESRLLRTHAELENYRKRVHREMEDLRKYAAVGIIGELLPVIDNADRAIAAAEQAGESESLLTGFQMLKTELQEILRRHHCQPIVPQGEPFDPNVHEAISQLPSDEVPAGHVMEVTLTGYKLHDRVVRPAQVVVSKGPAE